MSSDLPANHQRQPGPAFDCSDLRGGLHHQLLRRLACGKTRGSTDKTFLLDEGG